MPMKSSRAVTSQGMTSENVAKMQKPRKTAASTLTIDRKCHRMPTLGATATGWKPGHIETCDRRKKTGQEAGLLN